MELEGHISDYESFHDINHSSDHILPVVIQDVISNIFNDKNNKYTLK